jgi:hypothetical protein
MMGWRCGMRNVAAAVAALIVVLGLSGVGVVHSRQDRTKVAKMTERMKTVCVGRFLIDLPQEAEVSLGRAFLDGFDITTVAESETAFTERVRVREAEIGSQPNEQGKKSLELAKELNYGDVRGKLLVFGRWSTSWNESGKRKRVEAVALSGFAHHKEKAVSFDFSAKNYDPRRIDKLPKLMAKVVTRGDQRIPAEPGFCIDRALVTDPLSAEQNESVTMFAGLPGHSDLAIVFSTIAGTRQGPGMLARSAKATARLPFFMRAAFRTLREGSRTVNGLPGEELGVKVTEANLTTNFSFDWEMGGKADDVKLPLLTLELQTGINPRAGGKPVQSSLSEAALTELWDKILSSIRLRPTVAPKPVKPEPVVPPLGTYAAAGERCPQSGWWLCSDGGSGIGVLGGQRQYLRKGQRMPQALMLPPQTLWQKVRGLQPSYESDRPTAWKLVDKRTHSRASPPLPLEPAIFAARADATTQAEGAPPAEAVTADVGTYVKTGVACPASGWWRCEESHALDGTRWFAQGALLPAATFKVPPGTFGRSMKHPEVIQRRSTWQLVRYSQVPAAGADASGGSKPELLEDQSGAV